MKTTILTRLLLATILVSSGLYSIAQSDQQYEITTTPQSSGPTAEQRTNEMNAFIIKSQMATAASKYPTDKPTVLVNGMTTEDMLRKTQEINRKIQYLDSIENSKNRTNDIPTQSASTTPPEVAAPTHVEYYQENKNQAYTSEQIDRFLKSPCFRSLGFIQSLSYEEQDKMYCDCENKKTLNTALLIGGILFGGGILVFIFITAFSKRKENK